MTKDGGKRKAKVVNDESKKAKSADTSESNVLKKLLNGMSMETFDAEIFEKKPLHLKNVETCKGYFSRQELLNVLSQGNLEFSTDLTVTVYKNGQRENYEPSEDSDGIAKSKKVDKLLSSGYSVQFYQPQRHVNRLLEINQALEEHYGCLAGSSAYLTPPHSQALAPHHDDVDVFILQTEGSKHWKLYAPIVELAGEHSNDLDESQIGEPIMELTLEEGDMLYFPRGIIHQASTTDSFSTHVTISIYHHNSWANFMEVALPRVLRRAFEKDIDYRRGLPPNWLGFMGTQFASTDKSSSFKENFHRLVTELTNHVDEKDLHVAADEAALDFIKNRLPPTQNSFHKAFLKDHLNVRLRYKKYSRIVLQDDMVTLFHSASNCRQHHMGRCTCDDEEDEDEENDMEDDEIPLPATGISFPIECAPVLLHLYSTAPGYTSLTSMLNKKIADEDSIRGVIFRLIAEDLIEK